MKFSITSFIDSHLTFKFEQKSLYSDVLLRLYLENNSKLLGEKFNGIRLLKQNQIYRSKLNNAYFTKALANFAKNHESFFYESNEDAKLSDIRDENNEIIYPYVRAAKFLRNLFFTYGVFDTYIPSRDFYYANMVLIQSTETNYILTYRLELPKIGKFPRDKIDFDDRRSVIDKLIDYRTICIGKAQLENMFKDYIKTPYEVTKYLQDFIHNSLMGEHHYDNSDGIVKLNNDILKYHTEHDHTLPYDKYKTSIGKFRAYVEESFRIQTDYSFHNALDDDSFDIRILDRIISKTIKLAFNKLLPNRLVEGNKFKSLFLIPVIQNNVFHVLLIVDFYDNTLPHRSISSKLKGSKSINAAYNESIHFDSIEFKPRLIEKDSKMILVSVEDHICDYRYEFFNSLKSPFNITVCENTEMPLVNLISN